MTPSLRHEARQRLREAEVSPSPAGRRRPLPTAIPRSEHPMMLRSHSISSFDSELNISVGSPRDEEHRDQHPRTTHNTPGLQYHSIPEDDPSYTSPEGCMQWSPASQAPSPTSDEPFLNVPDLSPCSRNRVWGSRNKHTTNQDFQVWTDPFNIFDQLSPRVNTPESLRDPEDDKENIFATGSDYESPSEQEEENHNIDFDLLYDRRQDVFGAPFAVPFARPLAELSLNDDGNLGYIPPVANVPVATETVRPAMRIQIQEQVEDPSERWEPWENTLERGQNRDLESLSDLYVRGAQQSHNHGRQYPMRDDFNIQGSANVFLQARRITEYQRHQSRYGAVHDLRSV